MDDKESLKKLNDCDVFGIFQFETRVAVGIIKEIGIDTFEDMYAATTLGRPDPLSSNLHVKYGQRKRNEEYWESIPVIADIMDQSYGLPIFQESSMLLARRLAGFSGSEANALRKGLAKGKDNEDAMKKLKKLMGEFKERSQQAIEDELLSQDQLDEYVRILESFGGYGFNKSLSGDTLVRMADGSSRRLIEIHPGESLICYDDGEFKNTKAINIHDHGILDTFRITFDDGSFVDSSIQHKFMTHEGMTPLRKIIDNQLEIGYSDSEHLSFRRIISVKPLGKRHLYDLEVCSKSHNFCLQNGIVTSNSHAVSYAMVAYWSLYLKTYFPVEFMVSLLNFTDLSKKDEKGGAVLKKYIQYAKKLDVKISPPNINTSGVRFCLDGDTIRWGMSMVKGVANASVEEIILKRPFTSFSDFLDKVEKRKVNK